MNLTSIKQAGHVDALKKEIENRLGNIQRNTFSGYVNGPHYDGLGICLTNTERLCSEVRELLAEIRKIDGNSK